MKPIEVDIPPALFTATTSGQRYAIAGSTWVPVPSDTTLATLDRFVVYKPAQPKQDASNGSWEVKGSKGNIYNVRVSAGQWFCSCPGFGFRRKCRHISEKQNESR